MLSIKISVNLALTKEKTNLFWIPFSAAVPLSAPQCKNQKTGRKKQGNLPFKQEKKISKANAFMRHNHIRVEPAGPDRAQAILDIVPESRNPYGILHGGAFYTLADCACGCACRMDGRKYVTLQGGLNFLKSVSEGRVTAQATVRHRGRTTCLVEVEITAETGALLAKGDFTFFCTGAL